MMQRILAVGVAACGMAASMGAASAACPTPLVPPLTSVTHFPQTVLGLKAETYTWYDSQCLQRTLSLKLEGQGNPGHGGYAIQMTYQVPTATGNQTIVVNKESSGDGGFGYFVSHERYRTFTDGSSETIANKIFHVDDSPLGLGFAAPGTALTASASTGAFRVTTTYSHYGTTAADPVNANGDDTTKLPLTASSYTRYPLPVTMTWVFQAQTDAPRYDVDVDLTQVGGPDRVGFDLRAPYGVMVFDNGADGNVNRVMWGDRYIFNTGASPVTRDDAWWWGTPNSGARFNAMMAGGYEMGLYEPLKFANSKLADSYADERGTNSVKYNGGKGCSQGETQILPCDWEWPYQGLQYSLPDNSNTTPSNFKKIAWGSTSYYGAGTGLTKVWDSPKTSEPFVGFPASKHIAYSVCILLGKTVSGGLTRNAAAAATPNCASAVFK